MPFAPGCEPMKLLAGLDVTAKAIERAAEAIGAQIAQRDEQEIGRAKQLVLPVVSKQNIAKMYVLIDGVQVPVVAAETERRAGRIEGQRARTRECKIGCVFTQTIVDEKGWPIRDADSTTYVGVIQTEPSGSGIWPSNTFPAPFKSWTCIMPGSIYGMWLPYSTPMIRQRRTSG